MISKDEKRRDKKDIKNTLINCNRCICVFPCVWERSQ